MASFALSKTLSGVSCGYETMTDLSGVATPKATVASAKTERMEIFMLEAAGLYVGRMCLAAVERDGDRDRLGLKLEREREGKMER